MGNRISKKKDIPIIVVNLNGNREYDSSLCPSSVGDEIYTIHVSFNAAIIQYALDNFPDAYDLNKDKKHGNYYYKDWVYKKLNL